MEKISFQVPPSGIEIITDAGLTIYIYKSEIDGRYCVELETKLDFEDVRTNRIQHDEDGRPLMKVMINEGIVSNDGFQEDSKESVSMNKSDVKKLAQDLSNSADNAGCTDDLIVVSKSALSALLTAIGVNHSFDI